MAEEATVITDAANAEGTLLAADKPVSEEMEEKTREVIAESVKNIEEAEADDSKTTEKPNNTGLIIALAICIPVLLGGAVYWIMEQRKLMKDGGSEA